MVVVAAVSNLWEAEYLRRRYLEPGEAAAGPKKRRRRKRPKELPGGMRIVDDDVSWKSISNVQEKEEEEVEDGDLPVVAEFIDERPEEMKWMEEFRTSKKWRLLGDHNEESESSGAGKANSSEVVKHKQAKCSPELSPSRRGFCDSPDLLPSATSKSSCRTASGDQEECFPDKHLAHQRQQGTSHLSPPRRKRHDSDTDLLPPQKLMSSFAGLRKQGSARGSSLVAKKSQRHDSESELDSVATRTSTKASFDSDLSLPRAIRRTRPRDSPDLSPPRRSQCRASDSDLSPPQRWQDVGQKASRTRSPSDLLPPRSARDSKGRGNAEQGPQMLAGGKAGLVSADLLRRQCQEFRKQERGSKHLEDESKHAATVFRDKSGRKRDLKQEQLEQQKVAREQSERDEQYAKWGKGLAQSRQQQQQNVEDAIKEMQKPLARYIDDQDLDQMLRQQDREGDPMANFIKKRKSKEGKYRKEKPRYSGPAPPLNRFNIWPGCRWDGVDRSNSFEQKRFARIASKKAVQELVYKWSVEDM